MRLRIYLCFLFLLAAPAWAQVEPQAVGEPGLNDEDLRMMLPPPVSAASYPGLTADEVRSNYLRASLAVGAAYVDNAFSGEFTRPLREITITVSPSLAIDRTTPQQKESFSYSPGFTLYEPTSNLNAIDQNAQADYEYRFGPYSALDLTDSFLQTTNLSGQVGAFAVGGSAASGEFLLVPFAEQISDTLRGTYSHQYAANQMYGVGGNFGLLNFPDTSEAPGLYNSKSGGGSAFYARRSGQRNYYGVTYEYEHISATPPLGQSTTAMQSILPFYTLYVRPTISVSVSGGPQYFSATDTGTPTTSGWTPRISASIGSQTRRTDLNLSYVRTVTGGGGLLGVYKQNSGTLAGRLQFTHTLTGGLSFSYADVAAATPAIGASNPGGHSLSGQAFVQHSFFGEHVVAELGYQRIHQVYESVALVTNDPDTDRGYFSLSYQFAKSLGR